MLQQAIVSGKEVQLTDTPHGHILFTRNTFSPDNQWIVYDVRPQDDIFDGKRIEKVNIETKEVVVIYEATNNARVGVPSYHPFENKVVFIHGPEFPTAEYCYNSWRRCGMVVDEREPLKGRQLDARDVTLPFTAGALRGGTHAHSWHFDGSMVSFTYEDEVLSYRKQETLEQEMNIRNIGITIIGKSVLVHSGERNVDGDFTVLVSRTTANARPGSNEIVKAIEEGWVGENGYMKSDGTQQEKALVFQGIVIDKQGNQVSEVYIIDLPDDLTVASSDSPLEGTECRRPAPPKGVVQRRLTYTANWKYPGIQGPRHWLRTNFDGSKIAFMAKDDRGIVQIWTISPLGNQLIQVTHNPFSIQSSFSWSPDGEYIAYAADYSLFVTNVATGKSIRLTPKTVDGNIILPYSVVYSSDGKNISYMRDMNHDGSRYSQIFIFRFDKYIAMRQT